MVLHPHQGSGCRAGPICAARTGLAMLLMIIPVIHPSGASVAQVPWFSQQDYQRRGAVQPDKDLQVSGIIIRRETAHVFPAVMLAFQAFSSVQAGNATYRNCDKA